MNVLPKYISTRFATPQKHQGDKEVYSEPPQEVYVCTLNASNTTPPTDESKSALMRLIGTRLLVKHEQGKPTKTSAMSEQSRGVLETVAKM